MSVYAYPTRQKAFNIFDLFQNFLPLFFSCLLSWWELKLEQATRFLGECMVRHEDRLALEQWKRTKAMAKLKAMTNGGTYEKSSPPSTGRFGTVLHSSLAKGDLAWIRLTETGRVKDGLVIKRHPQDGWTEFRKGHDSWTLLDNQFEVLTRVRAPEGK